MRIIYKKTTKEILDELIKSEKLPCSIDCIELTSNEYEDLQNELGKSGFNMYKGYILKIKSDFSKDDATVQKVMNKIIKGQRLHSLRTNLYENIDNFIDKYKHLKIEEKELEEIFGE